MTRESSQMTPRLPTINPGRQLVARRIGVPRHVGFDLYHFLVSGSWSRLLIAISLFYLGAATVFAVAFHAIPGAVSGGRPGHFADAFFLSVQTFSTIGYGDLGPGNMVANILVTAEMLAGLLTTALATGLVFAKFARPTARVLFSEVAVISPGPPEPLLSFRVANKKKNRIIDAEFRVTLSRIETQRDGSRMRRMVDLELERTRAPFLALTWTTFHRITPQSPLYGQSSETLEASDALLSVSIAGIDEDLAAGVYCQHVYRADALVFDARFRDVMTADEAGGVLVDYSRFHDTVPTGDA